MYYVENILAKKLWDDGTFRYLVKWTEYDRWLIQNFEITVNVFNIAFAII